VPEASRHDLVVRNLDLLDLAARAFHRLARSTNLDRDDLVGEGQVALVKAACQYDPERGSFRSYALTRIKGAMIDAVRRDHFLPRSARERGHRMRVVSLEKMVGDGSLRISETLVDPGTPVEELVEQRAQLAEALVANESPTTNTWVTPSELEVLRGAARGETAEETADRLSKSLDTVKAQRKTALKRLGARSIAQAVYIARDQIAA
jgi:RNA polymerase sigma factor for flagellar operon FliA